MEIIKFEDWAKLNFRIGEVESISETSFRIKLNGEIFDTDLSLNAQKGDKIVVLLAVEKLVIPIVRENIPIVPDDDIELGSRIR